MERYELKNLVLYQSGQSTVSFGTIFFFNWKKKNSILTSK